jgi:hypothetical protein
VLNGSTSILWAMGFGMLTWSVRNSHVLARQCTGKEFGGEAEAGVCRDYKALWAMALCGTYVDTPVMHPQMSKRFKDQRLTPNLQCFDLRCISSRYPYAAEDNKARSVRYTRR